MVFLIDDARRCSGCTRMIEIGSDVIKRYPTLSHDGTHRGTLYDNEMTPRNALTLQPKTSFSTDRVIVLRTSTGNIKDTDISPCQHITHDTVQCLLCMATQAKTHSLQR